MAPIPVVMRARTGVRVVPAAGTDAARTVGTTFVAPAVPSLAARAMAGVSRLPLAAPVSEGATGTVARALAEQAGAEVAAKAGARPVPILVVPPPQGSPEKARVAGVSALGTDEVPAELSGLTHLAWLDPGRGAAADRAPVRQPGRRRNPAF